MVYLSTEVSRTAGDNVHFAPSSSAKVRVEPESKCLVPSPFPGENKRIGSNCPGISGTAPDFSTWSRKALLEDHARKAKGEGHHSRAGMHGVFYHHYACIWSRTVFCTKRLFLTFWSITWSHYVLYILPKWLPETTAFAETGPCCERYAKTELIHR